jgi:hypothetical protein
MYCVPQSIKMDGLDLLKELMIFEEFLIELEGVLKVMNVDIFINSIGFIKSDEYSLI